MAARYIPNFVTCLNLFSGCIACVMAFEANYTLAMAFILLSAVFDFFDGMLARLLRARSPIGKDLDSLADDISFGMAPSVMIFSLFKEVSYPAFLSGLSDYIPFMAFTLAVFSGLRLAKFNNDTRQTSSFVGLTTTATGIFWSSLIVGAYGFLISPQFNAIYLLLMVFISSGLLVSEIPMFSLKFKNLTWKDNKIQYIFLVVCCFLIAFLHVAGIAASIGWYVILSLITWKKA